MALPFGAVFGSTWRGDPRKRGRQKRGQSQPKAAGDRERLYRRQRKRRVRVPVHRGACDSQTDERDSRRQGRSDDDRLAPPEA